MEGTQPDLFAKTQQNLGGFCKACMHLGVCPAVLSKYDQDLDGEGSFDTLIESTLSARDDANIVLNSPTDCETYASRICSSEWKFSQCLPCPFPDSPGR